MKKFFFIIFISFLIVFTSLIKSSTRNLETKLFNIKEEIKILNEKKSLIKLENNYLTSPERLQNLKQSFFNDELINLQIKDIKKFNE